MDPGSLKSTLSGAPSTVHTRVRLKDLGEPHMTQFGVCRLIGGFSYGEIDITKFTVYNYF